MAYYCISHVSRVVLLLPSAELHWITTGLRWITISWALTTGLRWITTGLRCITIGLDSHYWTLLDHYRTSLYPRLLSECPQSLSVTSSSHATEHEESCCQAESLLTKLRAPKKSDLTWKRKIRHNPCFQAKNEETSVCNRPENGQCGIQG